MGAKDVLEFLGASGEETFVELTDFVTRGKTAEALVMAAQVLSDGKDVRQFIRDWVNHYRNLLMTKFIKNPQDVINMSVENIERIRRQSDSIELADINRGILELSRTMREAKWSTQPRILLELAVVNLSSDLQSAPVQRKAPQAGANVSRIEVKTGRAEVKAEPAAASAVSAEAGDVSGADKTDAGEAAESENVFDYDAVWNAVFEDGEAAKGSFYIIGSGGRLQDIGENEFTVVVNSEHVKSHAEKNRALLEDLMEKHTGKRRIMKLILEGTEKETGGKSVEEIAREAGGILGIDIEIQ